jgi:hypothetical protein
MEPREKKPAENGVLVRRIKNAGALVALVSSAAFVGEEEAQRERGVKGVKGGWPPRHQTSSDISSEIAGPSKAGPGTRGC